MGGGFCNLHRAAVDLSLFGPHLGYFPCQCAPFSSLQPEHVVVTEGPWLVLVGRVTALSLGAAAAGSGLSAWVSVGTWTAQVPRCTGRAAVPTQVQPQLCFHCQLNVCFHTQTLTPPDSPKVLKQVKIYALTLNFTQQQNIQDQVVITL